jgi:hypothetical protein
LNAQHQVENQLVVVHFLHAVSVAILLRLMVIGVAVVETHLQP